MVDWVRPLGGIIVWMDGSGYGNIYRIALFWIQNEIEMMLIVRCIDTNVDNQKRSAKKG